MFYKLSQKKLADALRILSIDAIQNANSGHPGMPMGMADIAEVLWNNFLVHNPNNPNWINRDRFILSNGHGSMLHYALLHLSGYQLTIEDLKNFRQLHSKTPGHPEYAVTPGIEATTGPLGQGLGMAVGMALAERLLATQFNTEHFAIIDHYTYCFVGDGCLMEGISHEVGSLAGTLGLHKLIVFWDNNKISIDGNTENWFTENVGARFRAYNWHVIDDIDGHDPKSIMLAIEAARANKLQPSLLCCNTIIGYGSSLAGTAKVHGSPFKEEELLKIRKNLAWEEPAFVIPEQIYAAWQVGAQKGTDLNLAWDINVAKYQQQNPLLYDDFQRRINGILPKDLDLILNQLIEKHLRSPAAIATREGSKIVLEKLISQVPELFGGSADLASSDLTLTASSKEFKVNTNQIFNYLHFGVREFGMFSILNGIALHKGFIPYGGTFLVFIDYARSALRLSAIMRQKVIYVLTHDSIGVGEDGPTHQPVEHLSMLRATPNISVWRPCDLIETITAWQIALKHDATTCLILSRQSVPQQSRNHFMLTNIVYGGYILYDPIDPKAILIATGSEVSLAMQVAGELALIGTAVRVVSMPNVGLFLQQSKDYQDQVLPPKILARVAVEASSDLGWYQLVGLQGKVLGVKEFGLSAPGLKVYQEFNLTVTAIKQAVLAVIEALVYQPKIME